MILPSIILRYLFLSCQFGVASIPSTSKFWDSAAHNIDLDLLDGDYEETQILSISQFVISATPRPSPLDRVDISSVTEPLQSRATIANNIFKEPFQLQAVVDAGVDQMSGYYGLTMILAAILAFIIIIVTVRYSYKYARTISLSMWRGVKRLAVSITTLKSTRRLSMDTYILLISAFVIIRPMHYPVNVLNCISEYMLSHSGLLDGNPVIASLSRAFGIFYVLYLNRFFGIFVHRLGITTIDLRMPKVVVSDFSANGSNVEQEVFVRSNESRLIIPSKSIDLSEEIKMGNNSEFICLEETNATENIADEKMDINEDTLVTTLNEAKIVDNQVLLFTKDLDSATNCFDAKIDINRIAVKTQKQIRSNDDSGFFDGKSSPHIQKRHGSALVTNTIGIDTSAPDVSRSGLNASIWAPASASTKPMNDVADKECGSTSSTCTPENDSTGFANVVKRADKLTNEIVRNECESSSPIWASSLPRLADEAVKKERGLSFSIWAPSNLSAGSTKVSHGVCESQQSPSGSTPDLPPSKIPIRGCSLNDSIWSPKSLSEQNKSNVDPEVESIKSKKSKKSYRKAEYKRPYVRKIAD